MSGRDEEEVVRMVFGDHPPENWRENQEFLLYLTELGNLGAERLTIEPERVGEELSTVQMSTQELAFSNYKTFIQTSDCSRQIYNEFANTEKHLENLIGKMPGFLEKCETFKSKAAEISTHRRLTSLTLSKHTTLLEILELPQLMDTVVRNQHYDEALELHAYVTKLARKQPDVKVLGDIARNVSNSIKLMLQQLLAQLRAPIQLPQCLKVISYLRRMDVFQESELRLKFLQARETWLHSVTNAVPRDDPYVHITRTMEVMRVHLFDIVTQYRAIFSDDLIMDPSSQQCDNRLLFSCWLSRRVEEFLQTLEQDLEQDIGSIESLLGQAMFFGLSFSRVGFDFRPLLAPIFERTVLKQMDRLVSVESNLKLISDSFIGLNLARAGSINVLLQSENDISQPPLVLIDFPPLAHTCNILLAGLNHIRLCAPVSIVGRVTGSLQRLLASCVCQLVSFYQTNQVGWRDSERLGFSNTCLVFKNILLPYIQACLSAVFPPKALSEICGFSVSDLQSKQLGFLDLTLLCTPLVEFLPKEPEEAQVAQTSEETEYVADRIAELAVAVAVVVASDLTDTEAGGAAEPEVSEKGGCDEENVEEIELTSEPISDEIEDNCDSPENLAA